MSILVDNRKAHFNYEIIERYEAGIELAGFEVKSLKSGKATLVGAYARLRDGQVYIVGMQISPYQVGNTPKDYDSTRSRKLLLNKKEIKELEEIDNKKGLTIVPLSLYSKGRRIKVELGVARGKKMHDKREAIKRRDLNREMKRAEA